MTTHSNGNGNGMINSNRLRMTGSLCPYDVLDRQGQEVRTEFWSELVLKGELIFQIIFR